MRIGNKEAIIRINQYMNQYWNREEAGRTVQFDLLYYAYLINKYINISCKMIKER